MIRTSAQRIRNQRVSTQVQDMVREMEQRTKELVRMLQITDPVRRTGEQVYRKFICGYSYWIVARHTPMERCFLRMMLTLALATDSSLQAQAKRVGRYLSNNYAYEWCASPVSSPGRAAARDMILRAADSRFDETPYAGQLGYVLFHHQDLRIKNVSDYSELYTRALALDQEGFFRDKGLEERHAIGLHRQPKMREIKLQSG